MVLRIRNLLTDMNLNQNTVFANLIEAIKFAHLQDYKPAKGSFDSHCLTYLQSPLHFLPNCGPQLYITGCGQSAQVASGRFPQFTASKKTALINFLPS